MRRYGRKKRSDLYAPYGTCRECGWTGQDWGFKYHGYCTKCHNEWRKAQAEERRREKPPNENIEVAQGVVITTNVRERLKKRAHRDVPRTREAIVAGYWSALLFFPSFIFVIVFLFSLCMNRTYYTFCFGICAVASLVMLHTWNRTEREEARKHLPKVDERLVELACERQKQIDEARAFYTSSEWRLVRKQIVEEQGRVCQKCRSHIKDDYDLTVDHIKPRSKFPELALAKSNLQVLCRRCNSAKGAIYNEASVTAQSTTPPCLLPS